MKKILFSHIAFWQMYEDVYRGIRTSEVHIMLKSTYLGLLAYRSVPMEHIKCKREIELSV